MQAYVPYRYVDSEGVCVISFPWLILSNPLHSSSAPIYIKIYTTNLLPLASMQAVLRGENHSYNGRTLEVPAHCASRYRRSPRLCLSPCFLPLLFPFLLLASTWNRVVLRTNTFFWRFSFTVNRDSWLNFLSTSLILTSIMDTST